MKRILLVVTILLLSFVRQYAANIKVWYPQNDKFRSTETDSYTFLASKGDVLKCRVKGVIMSGSYVKLYFDGREILNLGSSDSKLDVVSSSYEIASEGEHSVKYVYYRYGGAPANAIDAIYVDLTQKNTEDYDGVLLKGEKISKDGFVYVYDGIGLHLTSCTLEGNVVIPSIVKYRGYEYNVTVIDDYAFRGSQITSVIIPNTVKILGSCIFMNCQKLVSVQLPGNINKIPDHMFNDCSSLQSVNFENIEVIGASSFENCVSLKKLDLSYNVDSICSDAFRNCNGIKVLLTGNQLSYIGSNAFYSCDSLTKLVLDNGVIELGEYAFQYCEKLESVSLGKGIVDIGNAFDACSNIKELIFLEGCEKTIRTKFTNIEKLSLPSTILYIDDSSFYDCAKLSKIDLPSSVVKIGEAAFCACKSIVGEIVIPNSVKEISERAFSFCSRITSLNGGDGLETIGRAAFDGCSSLNTIKFGKKMKNIGERAFYDCSRLSVLYWNEGLENIGAEAFCGCKELTALKLPSSVNSIGEDAFKDCVGLSELDLGNGVQTIGSEAFFGCLGIKNLVIPNSVTTIGSGVFADNMADNYVHEFDRIEIGNGVQNVENVFFSMNANYPTIKKCVVGSGIYRITDYVSVFGSDYTDKWGKPQLYLLTNNTVDLYSHGLQSGDPNDPNCNVYVADSTKYTQTQIKTYGIRNIIHTSVYESEYSGKVPDLNLKSSLDGYDIILDKNCINAGVYNSLNVTFCRGDFSSTVNIPCKYTIKKAPLNIVPYNVVITYGDSIPQLNCFYQGLKNNETAEYALQKLPKVTTDARKGSNAGDYVLYASGAESENYQLAYQTGLLTIKRANQVITWNQVLEGLVTNSKIELLAVSSSGESVSYRSSNPSVASISMENGKAYLYTHTAGSVMIAAIQEGTNNFEAAQIVQKTIEIAPQVASGIELSVADLEIEIGENYVITANVIPSTVVDKRVVWRSSNSSIVSVNDGVIKALDLGQAVIFATTVDGSNLTAKCNVTVTRPSVKSLSLNVNELNLTNGKKYKLECTARPEDAINKEVIWSSNNEKVATVDENGIVTACSTGTATIIVTSKSNEKIKARCKVYVSTLITEIELDKSSLNMYVEDNVQLHATFTPEQVDNTRLKWSSSDESVALVSDNGVVSAKQAGEVAISVETTDGSNLSVACIVTVEKRKQTLAWTRDFGLLRNGDEMVEIGATNSSELPLSYRSDDENVVSIFSIGDEVYINPVGVGKTNISVASQGNFKYDYAELNKEVEVISSFTNVANVLVTYYSKSQTIDEIVVDLSKQLANSSLNVYTQRVEPVDIKVDEANSNMSVCDSIMDVIANNPDADSSYPANKAFAVDVNDYDVVIMIYPLWKSMMAAPMQTFERMYKKQLQKKAVAYIEYEPFGGSAASPNKSNTLRLISDDREENYREMRRWLDKDHTTWVRLIKDKSACGNCKVVDILGRKLDVVPKQGLYIKNGRKIKR